MASPEATSSRRAPVDSQIRPPAQQEAAAEAAAERVKYRRCLLHQTLRCMVRAGDLQQIKGKLMLLAPGKALVQMDVDVSRAWAWAQMAWAQLSAFS